MKNIKALTRLDAITIESDTHSLTITVGDMITLKQIEPLNTEITGRVNKLNNHQIEIHELINNVINKHVVAFGMIEEIEVL